MPQLQLSSRSWIARPPYDSWSTVTLTGTPFASAIISTDWASLAKICTSQSEEMPSFESRRWTDLNTSFADNELVTSENGNITVILEFHGCTSRRPYILYSFCRTIFFFAVMPPLRMTVMKMYHSPWPSFQLLRTLVRYTRRMISYGRSSENLSGTFPIEILFPRFIISNSSRWNWSRLNPCISVFAISSPSNFVFNDWILFFRYNV